MRHVLLGLGVALFGTTLATSAMAFEPFEMPWVNGEQDSVYRMDDHPNAVYVIEFFANYCGPCNQNAANVEAMATFYKNEPRVQVLDVGIDSRDSEIATWIRNHRPNHPVLKDVGQTVYRSERFQYIPAAVVADCNGVVKYRVESTWTSSVKTKIKNAVNTLLKQSCTRRD